MFLFDGPAFHSGGQQFASAWIHLILKLHNKKISNIFLICNNMINMFLVEENLN